MRQLTRHLAVVLTIGTAAAAVLWFVLFYSPNKAAIRSGAASVGSLDRELAATNQFLTGAAQKMDSRRWSQEQSRFLTQLDRVDSLGVFISRLTADLNRLGISQMDIAPDLNELLKNEQVSLGTLSLVRVRYHVRCVGRFIAVGKALEYLEQQPFFAGLATCNVAYNDDTNPEVLCEFAFVAYLREKG